MKIKSQDGAAHLLLMLVLVLGMVGGVGYYVYSQNSTKTVNNEITESDELSLIDPLPTTIKTVEEIRELVISQDPEAEIVTIELEEENATLIYRVELFAGDELVFDATTGALIPNIEEEDDGEIDDKKLPSGFTPALTFQEARELASEKVSGEEVKKIKIKVSHNKTSVIFRVYFTHGAQVDIDAVSGDVVRVNKGENKQNTSGERNRSSGGNSGSNKHDHSDHEDDAEDDDTTEDEAEDGSNE